VSLSPETRVGFARGLGIIRHRAQFSGTSALTQYPTSWTIRELYFCLQIEVDTFFVMLCCIKCHALGLDRLRRS
jgi:hypothetical protein